MKKFDDGLDRLNLRKYILNCLRKNEISLDQLFCMSDEEILEIEGLGKKSLEEIYDKMKVFCEMMADIQIENNEEIILADNWEYEDGFDTLEKMIGLTNVKKQVKRIRSLAKLKKDLMKQENKDLEISLNMVFKGNPGTAKTTVARILAQIFYDIGILSSDEIVEVGRADLVSQWAGHTACKVKEAFEKAEGKILFIDEAYSLVDWYRNGVADQAINTIIQEMENRRDKTIVIFAGYPEEMNDFLSVNPGLRSRTPLHINFPDYTNKELCEISELITNDYGFTMNKKAKDKVEKLCNSVQKGKTFGNGRFCRNLVESAVMSYASRMYHGAEKEKTHDYKLIASDFKLPKHCEENSSNEKKMGFSVA